jgi:hypothetical protein
MGRLTLSKREIAEIHLVLVALPFPPLPFFMELSSDGIKDETIKQAFDMATCELHAVSKSDDQIVNTHSFIAAMMLFNRWTAQGNSENGKAKNKIAKEACVLNLMKLIIDLHEEKSVCSENIQNMFLEVTKQWIDAYIPEGAVLRMQSTPSKNIINEHNLHTAMSHYSYAQGTMYSTKGSILSCEVHNNICKQYDDLLEIEKEDPDAEELLKVDKKSIREESMEKAEMYSKFSFDKLLVLAYQRILNDVLHGHSKVNEADVSQSAKDLLFIAFENFQNINTPENTANTPKIQEEIENVNIKIPQIENIEITEEFESIKTKEVENNTDIDFTVLRNFLFMSIPSDDFQKITNIASQVLECVLSRVLDSGLTTTIDDMKINAVIEELQLYSTKFAQFNSTRSELINFLKNIQLNQRSRFNFNFLQTLHRLTIDFCAAHTMHEDVEFRQKIDRLMEQCCNVQNLIVLNTKQSSISFKSSLGMFLNEIMNCCNATDKNPLWFNGFCASMENLCSIMDGTDVEFAKIIPMFNIKYIISLIHDVILLEQNHMLPGTRQRIETVVKSFQKNLVSTQ